MESRLVFNDTRKFGRAWLVKDPQEVLADLGPEPFDPTLSGCNLSDAGINPRASDQDLAADQNVTGRCGQYLFG